jgi:hypothetical protein
LWFVGFDKDTPASRIALRNTASAVGVTKIHGTPIVN